MKKTVYGLAVAASFALAAIAATPATAEDMGAAATYKDIEATLGIVPGFLKAFPEAGIAGAWSEFKSVQLNPATKLDGKTKELLGLAVAAQIPCQYCIYFHTAAAKANGASDEEIKEAVAMAAIVRHWSTVLNGMSIDQAAFDSEVDQILKLAGEKAQAKVQ
jgi:AhpD family alkylhydroperoxidase